MNTMTGNKRHKLISQILWDYNISVSDIEKVLSGKQEKAGHLTKSMIFQRVIESYSWFTVLELFSPSEIQQLLSNEVIKKLRSESLRKNYEFIQSRFRELIPTAG